MTKQETLRILNNFIDMMPKIYRKRNDNINVVRDIILRRTFTAGQTSCIELCRALGIDPFGHDFRQMEKEK